MKDVYEQGPTETVVVLKTAARGQRSEGEYQEDDGKDANAPETAQDWPWGGVVDVPAVIHETKPGTASLQEAHQDDAAPGTDLVILDAPRIEDVLTVFGQWMRLDVADGHASPATLRGYMTDVRQFLEWLYKEGTTVPMADEDDLKAYRALLVETYAISTVGRKLVGVRRFFEMAHARGVIPANPAAKLKPPMDKTDRSERIKYFTFAAVQQLLKLPTEQHRGPHLAKGLRDRAMLTLMAMHGLRVVEVQRLSLADFEPEAGDAGTLRVLGKGDKYRTILLTEDSRLVLDAWLNARNLMRLESEALFVALHWGTRDDVRHRMSRRSIRAMVDGYLEAAGLKKPGKSCHSLRHSYATLAKYAGADLQAISDSMGHASVTTTQVYAKIVDKQKNNPAKLLGGLLDE